MNKAILNSRFYSLKMYVMYMHWTIRDNDHLAKLYVYLDRLCNDVFLGIPKTLQTKHFRHEKFTGYVRLRFFFLLGTTYI